MSEPANSVGNCVRRIYGSEVVVPRYVKLWQEKDRKTWPREPKKADLR